MKTIIKDYIEEMDIIEMEIEEYEYKLYHSDNEDEIFDLEEMIGIRRERLEELNELVRKCEEYGV